MGRLIQQQNTPTPIPSIMSSPRPGSNLANQVLYFIEINNILGNPGGHFDNVSEVISLYGNFSNATHYTDFLNDLKFIETECCTNFSLIKLSNTTDYLYQNE